MCWMQRARLFAVTGRWLATPFVVIATILPFSTFAIESETKSQTLFTTPNLGSALAQSGTGDLLVDKRIDFASLAPEPDQIDASFPYAPTAVAQQASSSWRPGASAIAPGAPSYLIVAVLAGILGACVVLHAIMFVRMRDRLHLYLGGFGVALGLSLLPSMGLAYERLHPLLKHLGAAGHLVFFGLTVLFGIQLSRTLFATKSKMPRWDVALRAGAIPGVALIGLAFLNVSEDNRSIALLGCLGAALGALSSGADETLRAGNHARWYLAAMLVLCFAITAFGLRYAGIVNFSPSTILVMQASVVAVGPLLMLAVFERAVHERDEAVRHASDARDAKVILQQQLRENEKTLERMFDEQVRAEELRRMSETRGRQASRYDELTGLATATLFGEVAAISLAHAQRTNTPIGIVRFRLENLPDVATGEGSSGADFLLVTLAQRLKMCIRASDIAARSDSDEFVVALTSLKRAEDLHHVVEKLRAEMTIPVNVGNATEISPRVAISVALGPVVGEDIGGLLARLEADAINLNEAPIPA